MNPQQTSSHIIQHWNELSRDSVLNREQLIRQMIQDCVDEAVTKSVSETIKSMADIRAAYQKAWKTSNELFRR